jgi:hypothetical protein
VLADAMTAVEKQVHKSLQPELEAIIRGAMSIALAAQGKLSEGRYHFEAARPVLESHQFRHMLGRCRAIDAPHDIPPTSREPAHPPTTR